MHIVTTAGSSSAKATRSAGTTLKIHLKLSELPPSDANAAVSKKRLIKLMMVARPQVALLVVDWLDVFVMYSQFS
jgi:hypothetical protein